MESSSKKSKVSLAERLLAKFFKRRKATHSAGRAVPPDNSIEPVHIVTSRVLLAIYDPAVETQSGAKLSQVLKWNSADALANGFIREILEASGGKARYQVVERVEFDEFPAKTDGYRYDYPAFMDVLRSGGTPHQPEGADYQSIMLQLNILPRIAMHEIDEIWLFGFPHAGFYESTMGGKGAFWCNSAPMTWTSGCNRRFIVMGFSYERGVGEMLESFGHRAESLLGRAFDCQDFIAWAYNPARTPETVEGSLNLFQRFLCYEKIAPGQSGVGTIHFAPNSEYDYDWNNSRLVASNCQDWYNFPGFQNDIKLVSASEWGNGDILAHHKWWLKHLPRVAGRTGGVANNWWQYVMDPNLINP